MFLKEKNKKAQMQVDIVTIAVVVISLIVIAPILLKTVTTSIGGFASSINETSPVAATSMTYVQDKFTGFIDYIIIIFFLIQILLLFIFAFMVDTHPSFVIFYVITCMILMWFLPYLADVGDQIYSHSEFSTLVNDHLSMTGFFLQNLEMIVLGIMVISGLILYGKFRQGGGGSGSYTGG